MCLTWRGVKLTGKSKAWQRTPPLWKTSISSWQLKRSQVLLLSLTQTGSRLWRLSGKMSSSWRRGIWWTTHYFWQSNREVYLIHKEWLSLMPRKVSKIHCSRWRPSQSPTSLWWRSRGRGRCLCKVTTEDNGVMLASWCRADTAMLTWIESTTLPLLTSCRSGTLVRRVNGCGRLWFGARMEIICQLSSLRSMLIDSWNS